MHNIFFELDRLRTVLENKGLDSATVDSIIDKAKQDMHAAFLQQAESAMQQAIESGVTKRSPDFINDLHMDLVNMELTTQSGNMDFSEPPFPMLPALIQGGKPIKDGSGVYKVIPVGAPGKDRPKVSDNIYDAWKQLNAERIETAKDQYSKVAPKGSKTQFRTATSKQNANTQWVMPAQNKDFAAEMRNINSELGLSMEDIARSIVREYEESF